MKQYKIKIVGTTPYMQCKMNDAELEAGEKKRGFIIERPDVNKEDFEHAESACYRNDKGELFIPSEHIRGSLIEAGKYMKSKVGNAKKNMSNIVAAMFFIEPEELILAHEYSIDKRSAVNRFIKGRIIKIRPRWNEWSVEFVLKIDNDTITKETVKQLLEYAGNYCGIGAFRPSCKGMFGRFKIESLEEV